MDNRMEGTFSILAALVVLFSAMLDPRVSVALAVIGTRWVCDVQIRVCIQAEWVD